MTALFACMLGVQRAAPQKAIRLAERAQFIKDHPGWTFRDYDDARAGDIAFLQEYEKMLREAERKALDEAQARAEHGRQQYR